MVYKGGFISWIKKDNTLKNATFMKGRTIKSLRGEGGEGGR